MTNIYLVGFMGAGKSTVGRALAQEMNRPYLDTDSVLEAQYELSIMKIVEEKGEPFFRDAEAAVIQKLSGSSGLIVSLGGGAVLREENRRTLLATGTTLYLRASVETLVERLLLDRKALKVRPLLKEEVDREQLAIKVHQLLEQRISLYEKAHHSVDTDLKSVMEVVKELLPLIRQYPLASGREKK